MESNELTTRSTPAIAAIKEHAPVVGDVYVQGDTTYGSIYRLDACTDNMFEVSEYSLLNNSWTRSERRISERSIREYYSYVAFGLDDILKDARALMAGECADSSTELSDATTLVRQGKDDILMMLEASELAQLRAETAASFVAVQIAQQTRILDEYRKRAEIEVKRLKNQVKTLRRVISMVEVYTGASLDITTISEGEGASAQEPLTIRQRILFMDEEVAAILEDGQGLGHENKDQFYEWLKIPSNRDVIVPEQRCAVVMKPRRFHKRYSSDPYENRLLNIWNKHSFIVIRNGENVYVAESENLFFDNAAIPTKKDWKKALERDGQFDEETDRHAGKDLTYGSLFYAYMLQGLLDNTEYFGTHDPIEILRERGVKLIFDGEEDTLLGTGIKPFNLFVNDKNHTLRRGSRILYLGAPGSFLKEYVYKFSKPSPPAHGLYNIDKVKEGSGGFGTFGFKYLPEDNVYGQKSKQRRTWVLDNIYVGVGLIAYDNVSAAELEAYVKDRTQRKYYEQIFPMLLQMLKQKRIEETQERAFCSMMKANLGGWVTDEMLSEAIEWWKKKVIFTRPLVSDDLKSWRMIEARLKSQRPNLSR